jgi:hypothetical protein
MDIFVDKIHLRQLILRDKIFLYNLYQGQGSRLNNASETQMNTLIKILHLILNDHIELREQHYKNLVRAKRLKILKNNFEKNSDFVKVLRLDIEDKRKLLKQMQTCYPWLLHSLFNF